MTLSDKVRLMIENAMTSAQITSSGGDSPKTNKVVGTDFSSEDLETELFENLDVNEKGQELKDSMDQVKDFKAGNVGDLQGFTKQQFGNVRSLATNPLQFIFSSFGRLGKGIGIIAAAGLLFEIVNFIFDEMTKPGRAWDRRFKRIASREIEIFTERQEQEELRYGERQVIVTTRPYLRGGRGQVSGNYYLPPQSMPRQFYDTRVPLQQQNARAQGGRQRAKNVFRGR